MTYCRPSSAYRVQVGERNRGKRTRGACKCYWLRLGLCAVLCCAACLLRIPMIPLLDKMFNGS